MSFRNFAKIATVLSASFVANSAKAEECKAEFAMDVSSFTNYLMVMPVNEWADTYLMITSDDNIDNLIAEVKKRESHLIDANENVLEDYAADVEKERKVDREEVRNTLTRSAWDIFNALPDDATPSDIEDIILPVKRATKQFTVDAVTALKTVKENNTPLCLSPAAPAPAPSV